MLTAHDIREYIFIKIGNFLVVVGEVWQQTGYNLFSSVCTCSSVLTGQDCLLRREGNAVLCFGITLIKDSVAPVTQSDGIIADMQL